MTVSVPGLLVALLLLLISTNRTGWPLIFAMISYDKKMKNQIGYRDSLHDEYDEGRLSDLPLGIRSWPKRDAKLYSNFFGIPWI